MDLLEKVENYIREEKFDELSKLDATELTKLRKIDQLFVNNTNANDLVEDEAAYANLPKFDQRLKPSKNERLFAARYFMIFD